MLIKVLQTTHTRANRTVKLYRLQLCHALVHARIDQINLSRKSVTSPRKRFNKDNPVCPRHSCRVTLTSTSTEISIERSSQPRHDVVVVVAMVDVALRAQKFPLQHVNL